ncbi:phosphomannomutase/phosphoglucomutase [Zongyangia hominis]|uniref:Phosphomannomutase/phosphoglucomutase n=1 Tax=Zongyangia hominis TaxID=2763677 RepID=A0A926EBT3_9FIRM|nr:phosphomannomutase/phosphoglucomutase [Zongyangia hominis]MBC8570173.1 phosphomannomutase/phosphoglucomutase [Zongyangia hominis]
MGMDLRKLQNGSDIRGVAVEGIEGEKVNLTSDTVYQLSKAFALWLKQRAPKGLTIAVGHDSRISSPKLKDAACQALSRMGCQVFDCGLTSTPSMFMSTVFPQFQCDGAIMITASHLPFNRNGMKFFTRRGGLDKTDISAIITFAAGDIEEKGEGRIQVADLVGVYADFLVHTIRKGANIKDNYDRPLEGLKILVDAGNGAGGFFVDKVLGPLGADTTGSQFLEPDGMFPNHIPNPENEEAMASICGAVRKNGADFGIIFDTDVDRSSAVDRFGNEINRNAIIALITAIIAEEHGGTTIVTDSVTSDELAEFIEKDCGCVHHRFKRGYRNVINEALRLNDTGVDCQLAIETSGHAALKENYFLDDGAYLTAKILIKAAKMAKEGKRIETLIAGLKHPLESKELRIKIKGDDFAVYGKMVLETIKAYADSHADWMVAPVNHEGIRINFAKEDGNGWMLTRMSLHDPIIPINVESNSPGGCKKIIRKLLGVIGTGFDRLDLKPLTDFVG